MRYAPLVVLALSLSGCMGPATPAQRLSDTAYEFSTAMRFGRMDVAAPYVSKEGTDEFVRKHAAWGHEVRIVEVELAGLSVREKDNADVMLNVSWQRADEADVRVTSITQRWHDDRGWRIVSEERTAGDTGLLGEPVEGAGEAPRAASTASRFATRILSSD